VWCDREIADIVDALNTGTLSTGASCSGHGFRPGFVLLDDGRWLFIATEAQRHVIDAAFPLDINGSAVAQGEVPAEPSDDAPTCDLTPDSIAQACENSFNCLMRGRKTGSCIAAQQFAEAARLLRAIPPARDAGLRLTDEQIDRLTEDIDGLDAMTGQEIRTLVRAVLAAAMTKEKP
jgi:hypothetical protein